MKTKQVVIAGCVLLAGCSGGFTTGRGDGAWIVGTTSWLNEVNQAGRPNYSIYNSPPMDSYTQAEKDALTDEINKKGGIKQWKR